MFENLRIASSQFAVMPQILGLGSVASRGLVANPLVCTHGRNHPNHGSRMPVMSMATNSNPNPKVKNPKPKPGITKLRKDELADVLPWTGSAQQRVEKIGTPATWVARLAISLAGSAALYNYNTVAAAMASLYWAWDPVLSTAFANTALRVQYPHAGVWKARVLYAKVVRPPRRVQSADVFQEIFDAKPIQRPVLELVIGDDSSATLEVCLLPPFSFLRVVFACLLYGYHVLCLNFKFSMLVNMCKSFCCESGLLNLASYVVFVCLILISLLQSTAPIPVL